VFFLLFLLSFVVAAAFVKEASYVRLEVYTAVTMKNGVLWDVTPCGSCKNRVSEELSASFTRVTRIGELGTTLAVTSNRHASYS
jgi:hypothetical protein